MEEIWGGGPIDRSMLQATLASEDIKQKQNERATLSTTLPPNCHNWSRDSSGTSYLRASVYRNHTYWAIQAGLLTPLTFARHRLSPLAAFTSGAYFLHNGRR